MDGAILEKKMLKISVVTPSFNQAKYLKECLLSVKEQSYPDVEHLVMDGGSTDGSVEILREYAAKPEWSHLHWVSEPDRGQFQELLQRRCRSLSTSVATRRALRGLYFDQRNDEDVSS